MGNCLLIGLFKPFMFNIVVDTVGFKSIILGFVFFLSCLFFFPFSAFCIEYFFMIPFYWAGQKVCLERPK